MHMVHEMEIVKQYASSIWFKYNQVCVQEPKYRMRQDAVGGFSLLSVKLMNRDGYLLSSFDKY